MRTLWYRPTLSRWSAGFIAIVGIVVITLARLSLAWGFQAQSATAALASAAEPVVVIAGADARVVESAPSVKFGGSPVLRVNGGSGTLVATFVRFTIADISAPIEQAVVRLYATSASADGATISAADNTWDELHISWEAQPARGDSVIAHTDSIVAATWSEYPVTTEVTGNGDYSFVVEATSQDGAHFSSREGEYPPQLVLTLAPAVEPTETPTLTPTLIPTLTPILTPTLTSTLTPTLTSTLTPILTPTLTPTLQPTQAPTPIAGLEQVSASVETDPVPHPNDAADDIAIWIHPTDPELSTIIGTDKQGGLAVYDLSGKEIQYLATGLYNNVDIRDNFMLGGQPISLVATSERKTKTIAIYRVNPTTRLLEDVAARPIPTDTIYGACMFHSSKFDNFYFFGTRKVDGMVEQWLLYDNGAGLVDARLVRTFVVGTQTEGCVADDDYRELYIGEENVGIWKYGAEPHQGEERTLVDVTGPGGHLKADVEGLAIAYEPDGSGYLIASSQGSDSFVIYQRNDNTFVKTFEIVANDTVDGVSETDGIDVTLEPLGAAFPYGVFVAQDGKNDGANQNFKLVPWQQIISPPAGVPSP